MYAFGDRAYSHFRRSRANPGFYGNRYEKMKSLLATLPRNQLPTEVANPSMVPGTFFGLSFLSMKTIDRARLKSLMQREQKKFVDERPKSKALFDRASKSLLAGVPMNWMVKWAGAFPPFVREAQGAHFFDVDGHRYIDFCLGDTGAMTGHSPFATVKAAEEQ